LQGYEAYFPDQPDIVVARTRDSAGVVAALSQAVDRQHGCGRIWLVRTHVTTPEQLAWTTALRQQKLTATPVGHDGLSVINTGGSRCQ
jgi:hypothetical protein